MAVKVYQRLLRQKLGTLGEGLEVVNVKLICLGGVPVEIKTGLSHKAIEYSQRVTPANDA